MTVTLIKTKAEQTLIGEFAAKAKSLPGDARGRADAMRGFERDGLPHRRVEAWKYTDLRNVLKEAHPIAVGGDATSVTAAAVDLALGELAHIAADRVVFVNGGYRAQLSTLPKGVVVTSMAGFQPGKPLVAAPSDETVIALNQALASDGVAVSITTGQTLARPLMVVMVAAGPHGQFVSVRHRVDVGAGASAQVIEAKVTLKGAASGQLNAVTEVAVGDGAQLQHIQVGLEGETATSLASTLVSLEQSSTYRLFQLTVGTGLARNQAFVRFAGEGAKLDISGLMLGRKRQHCDTTLVIDHAVPNCESRELFKTVLDNEARAVFQGKVIVRPDAQKTDGKQMANALMLSEGAEFDSKPELEIYADDVVCGHGATVAELDHDLMFYLRSRGIPQPEGRAMLIDSFAGEALDKVADENVHDALSAIARAWLVATTSHAV
ncbi:MAG: Fe-S cluster assembly protein SufD [Hyphomicrobiaceae bacterium]